MIRAIAITGALLFLATTPAAAQQAREQPPQEEERAEPPRKRPASAKSKKKTPRRRVPPRKTVRPPATAPERTPVGAQRSPRAEEAPPDARQVPAAPQQEAGPQQTPAEVRPPAGTQQTLPAPPQAPAERTPAAPPSAQAAGAQASEGTAATEEEIAARALERALVQRGVLLLRPWRVEIAPEIAYSHDGFDTAVPVEGGGATLGRVRRHIASSSLGVRLGLPGKLQLDTVVPFLAARQRITAGTTEQRASADPGIADVRVSLTRHLLSTTGGTFQLLAGGTWRAPTGRSPYRTEAHELARGSGVHSFSASATAVRISDPVVLLATATYTTSLARGTPLGQVDAADTVKLSLSSLLAITPRESLSLQVEVERGGDLRLDGARVVGTERTSGVAQLGVAMVLSRRVLLSIAAAMGITEDAPDFQLGASVPVRF